MKELLKSRTIKNMQYPKKTKLLLRKNKKKIQKLKYRYKFKKKSTTFKVLITYKGFFNGMYMYYNGNVCNEEIFQCIPVKQP